MSRKLGIERILEQAKIYVEKPEIAPGGQHCGTIIYPIVIEIEDLELKISVGYHKARYKNRELAIELMRLAIDKIIPADEDFSQ